MLLDDRIPTAVAEKPDQNTEVIVVPRAIILLHVVRG
jgi:hypothetical protein